jgi:ribokinase
VVIGNAGLDFGLAVPRLPLAGETLIGTEAARAPGGKGLNQAVAAARCGVPVRFCAPLGNDEAQASEVQTCLVREGFDALVLLRAFHPTDFSLVMVLPSGENSIVSTSACSLSLGFDQAEPVLRNLAPGDVVLLQGNLSLETTGAILAAARQAGARTIFNPAPFWPGAEKLLRHCSLVIANRLEAEALGESIGEPDDSIVTLGAGGCLFDGRVYAAEPVAAVDTTGCGDTFCGVVAAALASGRGIDGAIGVAQKAAALTATRAGAFEALPSRADLSVLLAG